VNFRQAAKDRDCQMRIPGVCNFDNTTTVLAHVRRGSVAGMGQKPPDVCAVLACSNCHDVIDRRNNMGAYTPIEMDTMILDGLCRTLKLWTDEGYL
jgi:hypothetical protein